MSALLSTPEIRTAEESRGQAPVELMPQPAWRDDAAAALACIVLWALCVWTSTHVRADPELHTVALFGHLTSLVIGFGAVLAIDYMGLLWLLGKRSMREVLAFTDCLHLPVWAGTAGLLLTGVFLNPDLSHPLTCVKLTAVLVISLNGVCAGALQRRLARLRDDRPSARLLLRGAAAAGVSQIGWWAAMVIGFLNSRR